MVEDDFVEETEDAVRGGIGELTTHRKPWPLGPPPRPVRPSLALLWETGVNPWLARVLGEAPVVIVPATPGPSRQPGWRCLWTP